MSRNAGRRAPAACISRPPVVYSTRQAAAIVLNQGAAREVGVRGSGQYRRQGVGAGAGARRGPAAAAALAALALLALLAAPAAAGAELLPAGHRLFGVLLADPTTPVAAVRVLNQVGGRTYAEINIGDEFGLVSSGGGAVQLGVAAGVAGRFDLSAETRDFQVADYTLLLPLDVALGPLALRTAYQHVSSHLGDDYLDRTHAPDPKRSVDELRVTAAWRFAPLAGTTARLYAGGGLAFNVLPDDAGTGRVQAGVELARGGLFAAADLQLLERAHWKRSFTARAGWALAGAVATARIFVEYFAGPQPYLAFYDSPESRWALGLSFHR
jgi:hypothetical protein